MELEGVRLDVAIAARGLAGSRARAQAAIAAGHVTVNDLVCSKAAFKVTERDRIACLEVHPFAGRGGVKLNAALDEFDIDPAGMRCLDVGASTGGFTDCLLRRRATHVTAVDVGSNQMAPLLAKDPRVTLRENTNARFLVPSDFDDLFDIAVVDVSFISITLLFLPLSALVMPVTGLLIALIKPQFEGGRDAVGSGGVVRDESLRLRAVESVVESAALAGLACLRKTQSPIRGGDGNQEYLALFAHGPRDKAA